jgi:uncharacterized protein (DUF362 family)
MSCPGRRKFLKTTAMLGGGILLGDALRLPRPALSLPDDTPLSLAIAHWDRSALAAADLVEVATKLTEAAIADLGGMGRFVGKGDIVWVKPNIGWNRRPELAANTNPEVVATLVRLCFEAGAKTVKVGDHPTHPARQAYQNSGIAAAAEAVGAQIVYLDERRFREVELGGERLESWPVYTEMLDADLVINVPIAKHHGLTKATLAMKNYMGVIGGRRGAWHQHIDMCLADITAYMRPRLCVLDAVRILIAHGPQGGSPDDVKLTGTVAAGTDILALDAYGATLMGHDPADLSFLQVADRRGLGTLDYRTLPLTERTLS